MKMPSNAWIERYSALSRIDEIKRRARVTVEPIQGLGDDSIELACRRLLNGLSEVFVPSDRLVKLMHSEVDRAKTHAVLYYSDPLTVLDRANADSIDIEPYAPTCITGPAGTGKTRWRRALARVLGEVGSIELGPGYGCVPLVPFTSVLVGTQRSISQVLRPLARPEIGKGRARISEADLPGDCARWQALVGGCLFGVDELQFLAQSKDASTLVTTVLLALLDVKTPWFFMSNYSLGWKLVGRPPEATQRLLSRPVVLLPEAPGSKDWREILQQYQYTAKEVLAFELVDREYELWNCCAGLKRLLLALLEIAYRNCRECGRWTITWPDVERAYRSGQFKNPRTDVEAMIAYAVQGGDMKQDLKCPFEDDGSLESIEKYKEQLRNARREKVVAAVIDSSLSVEERKRHEEIKQRAGEPVVTKPATVIKMPRVKKTARSLIDAGRRFNDER